MPRTTKASTVQKAQDRLIEAIYYRHAQGVQISILDIPKVYAAGRAAIAAGGDLDAVRAAVVGAVDALRRS